jgi:D-alanyl-D-alanine endopeptidase (penicillin-binding protein 7)
MKAPRRARSQAIAGPLLIFLALQAFLASTAVAAASSGPQGGAGSARATPRAPKVRAEAAVVMDAREGRVLYTKNERERRPIASLTKLMTALVYLESEASLDSSLTLLPGDFDGAGKSMFRRGEQVRARDLFYSALLKSDNVAARGLARASGLPADEFVARMNRKAILLGLDDTHFTEPTGLDAANVSTALDCVALVQAAARNPYLAEAMARKEHSFRTSRGIKVAHSTNRLLVREDSGFPVGKTGFILEAGYCIASCFHSTSRDIAVVVLGAHSSGARFREANALFRWALNTSQP